MGMRRLLRRGARGTSTSRPPWNRTGSTINTPGAPDAACVRGPGVRSGRLTDTFTPSLWSAAADDRGTGCSNGWEALANVVAKYLRRQSVLEALEQLSRARERVLQLWAVAEQVPHPAYGLVSLLDNPAASLAPAIAVTYAGASADDVRNRSAHDC